MSNLFLLDVCKLDLDPMIPSFTTLLVNAIKIVIPIVLIVFGIIEMFRDATDNDDFINPDLQERLVIGDDSISIFTYDIKSNFFEIRDNIGTENIFSSFSDFSSFLNEIMDSCS